jgi:hypothetical protein
MSNPCPLSRPCPDPVPDRVRNADPDPVRCPVPMGQRLGQSAAGHRTPSMKIKPGTGSDVNNTERHAELIDAGWRVSTSTASGSHPKAAGSMVGLLHKLVTSSVRPPGWRLGS